MSFCDPAKFMQSTHLHLVPQMTPAWKHSQYFSKHSDRLHRHPMLWPLCGDAPARATPCPPLTEILGLKAFGFLARVSLIALSRTAAKSKLFWQSVQLHPSQNNSLAKHSQYNLRHRDFLQLQGFRLTDGVVTFSLSPDRGTLASRGEGLVAEGSPRLLLSVPGPFAVCMGLGSNLIGVFRERKVE